MLVSEDGRFDALSLDEGCFEGEVGHYVRALPDKLHKFDYVPVEVRSKFDPYTVWAGNDYKISKDNSLLQLANYGLLIAGTMFAILTWVSYFGVKRQDEGETKALRK